MAPRWHFEPDFIELRFGWQAEKKAAHAVHAAALELQRAEPASRREGALLLLERLWPAVQQVNRAPGHLDEAIERALATVLPLLAPATEPELERLWTAIERDWGGLLTPVGAAWGALCGDREAAARWAERLERKVRRQWSADPSDRCPAAVPYLASLEALGRRDALLAALSVGAPDTWAVRRFGARALGARQGADAAIEYALASTTGSPADQAERAAFCEEALLTERRDDEAYARFALDATHRHTHLDRFRALHEKYPARDANLMLEDLVAATPGDEGKWFATAHRLDRFDRALALAAASPADPKVLLRAARDHAADRPEFALEAAVLALRWLASGRVYKATDARIDEAADRSLTLAAALDLTDPVRARLAELVRGAREPRVRRRLGDRFA